jgi:hypothetical protein
LAQINVGSFEPDTSHFARVKIVDDILSAEGVQLCLEKEKKKTKMKKDNGNRIKTSILRGQAAEANPAMARTSTNDANFVISRVTKRIVKWKHPKMMLNRACLLSFQRRDSLSGWFIISMRVTLMRIEQVH